MAKNLQHLNAHILATQRDKSLTPEEKRQKLDGLIVERNALLKAAALDSKGAQANR